MHSEVHWTEIWRPLFTHILKLLVFPPVSPSLYSYRALPDAYPMASCSSRTTELSEMLNDRWVSVPTGSEDFAFKNMRWAPTRVCMGVPSNVLLRWPSLLYLPRALFMYSKNIHEEELFKCEDSQYEFDLVLDSMKSSLRRLEKLSEQMHAIAKVPRYTNVLHSYLFSYFYPPFSSSALLSAPRVVHWSRCWSRAIQTTEDIPLRHTSQIHQHDVRRTRLWHA